MSTIKLDHGSELGLSLDWGGSLGLVENACKHILSNTHHQILIHTCVLKTRH